MKVYMLISTTPPYLPVGVFDTQTEAAHYLGLSSSCLTIYRDKPDHIYHNKLNGELVTLLVLDIDPDAA